MPACWMRGRLTGLSSIPLWLCIVEHSLDSSQTHSLGGQLATVNSSLQPPELETIVSSRPPTRQPSTGIRTQLMQLTREEMKQQELAVSAI